MRITGNRVLVEPLPQAEKSAGGIFYAQTSRDDQTQYRVLAVGPGKRTKTGVLVAPECQAGDHILAPLYHDHTILPDGRRVIDAAQIIAVLSSQ